MTTYSADRSWICTLPLILIFQALVSGLVVMPYLHAFARSVMIFISEIEMGRPTRPKPSKPAWNGHFLGVRLPSKVDQTRPDLPGAAGSAIKQIQVSVAFRMWNFYLPTARSPLIPYSNSIRFLAFRCRPRPRHRSVTPPD